MANDERVKFDWKQNDGIKESSQKATRQDLTKNSKVKGMRMKLEKIEKKNTCQLDKVYILCINVRLPVYWSANTAALSPLHLPLSLAFILRTMWVYMSVIEWYLARCPFADFSTMIMYEIHGQNDWHSFVERQRRSPPHIRLIYCTYYQGIHIIAHSSFLLIELLTSLNSFSLSLFDSIFPKKKQTTEWKNRSMLEI